MRIDSFKNMTYVVGKGQLRLLVVCLAVTNRRAGVLLVSLELDEVMNLSDRILVMYEGEIVGELDPKKTTVQELGLYMSGAKRNGKEDQSDEK